jgi:hypothetical protein
MRGRGAEYALRGEPSANSTLTTGNTAEFTSLRFLETLGLEYNHHRASLRSGKPPVA